MIRKKPDEHDELFVQLWGAEYRAHPEYSGWLKKVRENPNRGLAAHKNDLRDRVATVTDERKTTSRGW